MRRAGPPPQEPGPKISRREATDPDYRTAATVPKELRTRQAASRCCHPLADGRRDPLDAADEQLTERELDSWRAAWTHLHAFGLPAVVPDRVLADGSRVA